MPNLTIVVDCNDQSYAREICDALQRFPEVTAVLPDHPAASDAQYASCWFPNPELLTRSPELQLIQAASAGVDHLPEAVFASDVPLCRVVDEDFRHGMFEYALWGVLWFQRHFDRALAHQRQRVWKIDPQRAAADYHVGVMGLGRSAATLPAISPHSVIVFPAGRAARSSLLASSAITARRRPGPFWASWTR